MASAIVTGVPYHIPKNNYFIMGDGYHAVIWVDTSIKYKTSSDNGASWSGVNTVSGTTGIQSDWNGIIVFGQSASSASTIYMSWATNGQANKIRGGYLTYSTITHSFSASVGSTNIASANHPFSVITPRDMVHIGSYVYIAVDNTQDGQSDTTRLLKVSTTLFGSLAASDSVDLSGGYAFFVGRAGASNILVGISAGSAGTSWLNIKEFNSSLVQQGSTQTGPAMTAVNCDSFMVTDNNNYQHIFFCSGSAYQYAKRTSSTSITTFQPLANGSRGQGCMLLDASQYRVACVVSTPTSVYKNNLAVDGMVIVNTSSQPSQQTQLSAAIARTNGQSYNTGTVAYWTVLHYDPTTYSYEIWVGSEETNAGPSTDPILPPNAAVSFDPATDDIYLEWGYSDTDDSNVQTSYQIQIQDSAPGSSVQYVNGSGNVTGTPTTITSAVQNLTINAGQLSVSTYGYQWRVRGGDVHGDFGSWSPWNTFYTEGTPTAAWDAGQSSILTATRPYLSVEYSDPETTDMSVYRFYLRDSTGTLIWDSDQIIPSVAVASGASFTGQLDYELENFTQYVIGVKVCDTAGTWSPEVQKTFYTTFTLPPPISASLSVDSDGIATISGTSESGSPTTAGFRIYRWSTTLNEYILVEEVTGLTYSVIDYGFPIGTTHYKVVSYSTDGNERNTLTDEATFSEEQWMLASSGVSPVRLDVTGYTRKPEQSQQFLEPMGRNRVISLVFQTTGAEGEFRVFADAADRNTIESALIDYAAYTGTVYLKTPFGTVHNVSLGSMTSVPQTGGHVVFQVPYFEVGDA